MAIRAVESRFEQMTVNDENEPPVNGGSIYHKSKVRLDEFLIESALTALRARCLPQCQYPDLDLPLS